MCGFQKAVQKKKMRSLEQEIYFPDVSDSVAMYGLLGIRGSETAYLGQMSPEQHVKTFFKRLDLDGDGSISREEFYRGALVDPTILQILKLVRLI
ncbi:unnamed protein product [Dibothriocephalus latus]|uniref:EF-hand domain-containing protein n=1 Tax=Dibothriocephalus latus TaxID=60516 RepID=A0A3P7QE97_DIBLA|nr:unnamed protein product [Dibothriocephalus latus]